MVIKDCHENNKPMSSFHSYQPQCFPLQRKFGHYRHYYEELYDYIKAIIVLVSSPVPLILKLFPLKFVFR